VLAPPPAPRPITGVATSVCSQGARGRLDPGSGIFVARRASSDLSELEADQSGGSRRGLLGREPATLPGPEQSRDGGEQVGVEHDGDLDAAPLVDPHAWDGGELAGHDPARGPGPQRVAAVDIDVPVLGWDLLKPLSVRRRLVGNVGGFVQDDFVPGTIHLFQVDQVVLGCREIYGAANCGPYLYPRSHPRCGQPVIRRIVGQRAREASPPGTYIQPAPDAGEIVVDEAAPLSHQRIDAL
jgi:hypothetical protein